ncbi:hypothetical protein HM25_003823 [Salmonella enterica subsp. enterica serovar Carno]|nr:hypothetical protein [Salmonella enterica]ECD2674900.1 hypothetical protein [Salmonella enterica subsp. enterica serovar Korlebu]ECI4746743.1 hypothetical protein [Salmonella enterica subsp. enterica]ECK7392249.1 hypothetical protein [Salmonella enterica subsp. enterica serovar Meleagridis]ECY3516989.1 hypothetical protein [Salmonella enterica subsp. enterica serovar Sekondi]EDC1111203.1 hypothetical protein [Salmonella enterica subsp. enterica serovar Senftenberg]EDH9169033.1 hypothetical
MKQAGGAHKTVSDRMALAERFCKRLVTELNVQIRNVRHLNARHIEDYIRHRLAQGFGQKEALAMVAMDLGHGDGRGRYVAQVYRLRGEG